MRVTSLEVSRLTSAEKTFFLVDTWQPPGNTITLYLVSLEYGQIKI